MDGLILQDWVSVRGAPGAAITRVVQSELAWADLAPYRDVVAWLEVREWSADAGVTLQLQYQTAVARDEGLFASVAAVSVAVGVTVTPMLAATAAVPLAQYLRWSLAPITPSTTNPWDATFRVLLAANRPARSRLQPSGEARLVDPTAVR